MMHDTRKGRLLLTLTIALMVLVLAYTALTEFGIADMEGYIQRRLYYERSISGKGMDLHKAMHWRESP